MLTSVISQARPERTTLAFAYAEDIRQSTSLLAGQLQYGRLLTPDLKPTRSKFASTGALSDDTIDGENSTTGNRSEYPSTPMQSSRSHACKRRGPQPQADIGLGTTFPRGCSCGRPPGPSGRRPRTASCY